MEGKPIMPYNALLRILKSAKRQILEKTNIISHFMEKHYLI
jgi:hypothetical protein